MKHLYYFAISLNGNFESTSTRQRRYYSPDAARSSQHHFASNTPSSRGTPMSVTSLSYSTPNLFYQIYNFCNSQSFRHPSPNLPSSRTRFNVNPHQQTHSLQTYHSFYTFICRSSLEQHIILQLPSSASFEVEMSPRDR